MHRVIRTSKELDEDSYIKRELKEMYESVTLNPQSKERILDELKSEELELLRNRTRKTTKTSSNTVRRSWRFNYCSCHGLRTVVKVGITTCVTLGVVCALLFAYVGGSGNFETTSYLSQDEGLRYLAVNDLSAVETENQNEGTELTNNAQDPVEIETSEHQTINPSGPSALEAINASDEKKEVHDDSLYQEVQEGYEPYGTAYDVDSTTNDGLADTYEDNAANNGQDSVTSGSSNASVSEGDSDEWLYEIQVSISSGQVLKIMFDEEGKPLVWNDFNEATLMEEVDWLGGSDEIVHRLSILTIDDTSFYGIRIDGGQTLYRTFIVEN